MTEPSQIISIRSLLVVWRSLLVAAVLFTWIAEILHSIKASINPRLYGAICVVAVSEIGIMFFMRKQWKTDNSGVADAKNLRRIYAAQLVLMACSLAVVLYGLVVRLMGATLKQALPFYIIGSFLLLYFKPRRMDTA